MGSSKRPSTKMGFDVTLRAVSDADPAGRRRWRLEWYPPGLGGKMKTLSLGERGDRFTTDQAAELARATMAGLDLSAPTPETAPVARPEVVTVEDLLQLWLGHLQEEVEDGELADKTRHNYRNCAIRLMGPKRGEEGAPRLRYIEVARLSEEDLRQHRNARLAAGDTASTINLDLLTTMSAAWSWAQREGLIGARVYPRPSPADGPGRYNHYTPTTLQPVERVLAELAFPWHRAILQILWGTGARVSEACGLTWEQIDLTEGEMFFRVTKTRKRGTPPERWAPIIPRTRAGLAELDPGPGRRRGPILPPSISGPARAFGRVLERACRRAEVRMFTPHALRRLAVDELRRQGYPLEVVAAITGHSIQTMLEHYRQPSRAEIREAAAQLGGTVIEGPWPEQQTG